MLRPHNCWALLIDGHEAAARCLAAELPWLPANHPMLLHRQQRVKAMSATLLLLAVKCCTLDLQWDLAPMVAAAAIIARPYITCKGRRKGDHAIPLLCFQASAELGMQMDEVPHEYTTVT
ncbi:hypothetical protein OPV22_034142 [Ensete ventricosum]|uniref:Cyclin C-terminal domain-containing protein n=1 Tax=Ensete ventricosum TaxID=4639 RepID=A0AAV8P1I0_ENSVE|nr:hypothetical protein OPV22_034142 [Ensete ventricosum]